VNPDDETIIDLHCFGGRSGCCEIFDDDGTSLAYLDGGGTLFRVRQKSTAKKMEIDIVRSGKKCSQGFRVIVRGMQLQGVESNRKNVPVVYDDQTQGYSVGPISVADSSTIAVGWTQKKVHTAVVTPDSMQKLITRFRLSAHTARQLFAKLPHILKDPTQLHYFTTELTPVHLRCILEYATDCGFHYCKHPNGNDYFFAWSGAHLPVTGYLSQQLNHTYERVCFNGSKTMVRLCKNTPWEKWAGEVRYGEVFAQHLNSEGYGDRDIARHCRGSLL
jgi:hypothetical protein